MTRISDLNFAHTSALFRGDGGGVAVILRDRPFPGSCWARIETPGAGITAEFIRLDSRMGGPVDGHIVVEAQLWAVSGDADDAPPLPTGSDARLTGIRSAFEVEGVAYARRADAESGARLLEDNARIAANSFEVRGSMEGRTWLVSVGPTVSGATSLVCRTDGGELRRLLTSAPRSELERAREEPVTVPATYIDRERRPFGGIRLSTRTIQAILSPKEGDRA